MSIPKTKLTVSGYGIDEEDKKPMVVRGGEIERIDEFPYLGSVVVSNGRRHAEVDRRIANASKDFGALCKAIFDDENLSLSIKRKVYNACDICTALWVRDMDSTAKTPQKVRMVPTINVFVQCSG